MSNNNVKEYYTIPVKKEKKSTMNSAGVPERMLKMTDENGVIQIQLERVVAIEKLVRVLYTDPKVGIREYVNNEARPCRDAIKKGHDASVHITVVNNTRNIIIEGRGSMGMTMDVFRDVYTVLGRSGNLDEHESGQFGFGKVSYMCLSDVVIFETYARETDERFGFIGKSGTVYEPIPEQYLSIKEYGTKVTLHVGPDINMYDLVKYIIDVSKFLNVPVFLELPASISMSGTSTREVDAEIHESGIRQIGPVDMKDFLRNEIGGDTSRCQFIKIEDDDYHLVAVNRNMYGDLEIEHTYLIGIPINNVCNFPFNNFTGYVLNIKNERKYMPMDSRADLAAESAERLCSEIKNGLQRYFSNIQINNLGDYYELDNIPIKQAHCLGNDWGFTDNVILFSKLLKTEFEMVCTINGEKKNEKFYTAKMSFKDILEIKKSVYYTYNLNKDKIIMLKKIDPNSIVVLPSGSLVEKRTSLKHLDTFGLQSVTEYLKTQKNQDDVKR